MSPLLMPLRVRAMCKYKLMSRYSNALTKGGRWRVGHRLSEKQMNVWSHQQRQYTRQSGTESSNTKLYPWFGGIGAGIVLALGLKYRNDGGNSLCDADVSDPKGIGSYHSAVRVSRDLVERIKVGCKVQLLLSVSFHIRLVETSILARYCIKACVYTLICRNGCVYIYLYINV